jgi:hypothetical protein
MQHACAHTTGLLCHAPDACSSTGLRLTLLPANGGFALASALLTETLPWTALCLRAWRALPRVLAAGVLGHALGAAAAALQECVRALEAVLRELREHDADGLVQNTLGVLGDSTSSGHEEKGTPAVLAATRQNAKVLQALLEDQRNTVGRLATAAGDVKSCLAC